LPYVDADDADILTLIGFIYRNKYDLDRALEAFEESLVLKKKYTPDDLVSIATTIEGLAIVYGDKGDYDNALRYVLDCLKMRKKCLPPNHLDIGTTFNIIADCYTYLNNRNTAIEYYKDALAVFKQTLPSEDPLIEITEKNIQHGQKNVHSWISHGRKYVYKLKARLFSS
jgi:tetratricopeptide (TPR) repeat protein